MTSFMVLNCVILYNVTTDKANETALSPQGDLIRFACFYIVLFGSF